MIKDKLAEVEQLLDEYEVKIGFPKFSPERETCEYLDLTREQLKRYTPEELQEIHCVLASFGVHVQRAINRHNSRLTYAQANLKIVFGKECSNYNVYSYEDKKNSVIAGNEYAKKLHELEMRSQMMVDRLSYLPAKIQFMSTQIESLVKGRKRGSYDDT